MIDRATVDRILDAVRIEEVIGDFVSLKKHGTSYLGLCPFHQDKHASMSVSPAKGIFKCFACGKAGSAATFVMEHEHLSYPDALRYLAKKYNIEIKEREETPEEIAGRMKHESLTIVSEFAQKYYQDLLWNSAQGKAIGLSYFHERSFTDETIRKFQLGYAANRPYTLCDEALRKGYKEEYLVDSGLCIKRDNGQLADRFFERVMFPIHSLSGRVIAFGGRTLKNDKTIAKYVNSPQTEIYDKSNTLYGLYFAKNAIIKNDKCILVEGYADVISMHQAGIENVVASSGTSLTKGQIRLIKRFTEKVTIIYDGDAAGIKAAIRGIDLVLEEGLKVKVVLLPPEDDPDTFAKAHTKDEILDYISEGEQDFISFKSDLLESEMAGDPLRKAQLINDIIASVSVIPDPVLRSVYVEAIADRFGQKQETILGIISKLRYKRREIELRRNGGSYAPDQQTETVTMPVAAPADTTEPDKRQQTVATEDNAFLGVCEKEILYYLLKWGNYNMYFEENMVYGAQQQEDVTVDSFIRNSLAEDDLEFVNTLYGNIYNEYFEFNATLDAGEEAKDKQEKILRHFTSHPEQAVAKVCLDLVVDAHRITVGEYEKALVPEVQTLAYTVPKAINLYKQRITELMCNELQKGIRDAQASGNKEAMDALVERLQILNHVKNSLAKELNRL